MVVTSIFSFSHYFSKNLSLKVIKTWDSNGLKKTFYIDSYKFLFLSVQIL